MTTILICAEEPLAPDIGFDDARVIDVEELCRQPLQMASLVPDDETDLILAIHRKDANLGAVQSAARRLGFDPLAVGVVDLDSVDNREELPRTLRAAMARASRFPGSVPEQVKLLPTDRRTRRGFLSIGAPTYVGAPMIDQQSCVAGDGCRTCASACPVEALTWSGGEIAYDTNTCVACGICVTACPTGSVRNPAVAPEAVEAEIVAAIAHAHGPIGIRYRCRSSTIPGEQGWHQVEIPCTGMLSVGWLLAPTVLGACDVEAVPCREGGCPLHNDEHLANTVCDATTILDVLGIALDAHPIDSRDGLSDKGGWFAHGSTGRMIDLLASSSEEVVVTLASADVGTVTIDSSTCTACQMCARICPTDALSSTIGTDGVHIDFDPRICVACGQCVLICPEIEHDAIVMTRRFDLSDWALGRREVRHDPTPLCEACGRPVAPAAMLSRIEAMLGDDAQKTMAVIGKRCLDCRGR